MRITYIIYFITLAIILLLSGCKKPLILSKGNLDFSQDTVVFDTVFTTIGSTTKLFKIYNPQNSTVQIEAIELMGGSSSPFRINVDGVSGIIHNNLELEGKDSLFVFVEVTLNSNGGTQPMVIEDRIRFRTNGVDQFVQLAAWGQDAYFHYSYISTGDLDLNEGTWPNDKPHVIYGGAFVDEGKSLTIQQGTDIYLHKNAVLYVYKGTLNINGTLGNEVTFQGDRLEADYADVTGQYYGVYLDSARSSTIDYAIIKNGTTGIHIEGNHPLNSAPAVTVRNSTIYNNASYGILNFFGGTLKAENCIIAKNEFHAFFNLGGSEFDFNHCHLLGYNSGENSTPAVGISNYYTIQGSANVFDIGTGRIINSLVYGDQSSEIAFDTLNPGGVTLNFDIQYCLIKKATIGTEAFWGNGLKWNQDPQLINVPENDYKFWSTSPLNGAGITTSVLTDILGTARTGPDIGAYEL